MLTCIKESSETLCMKVSGDTADTADGRGVLDGDGGQRAGQGRQETDLPLRLSQSYSNTGEKMLNLISSC
jgi:hypothetical protein